MSEMKDKICLITGANSGIGKIAARELARMGAEVVMVCRDPERGRAALAEVRRESGNPSVALLQADLGSFASIRACALEFKSRYRRLDVLINNAGAMLGRRQETREGIEATFGVNHLGPFLLTELLLDVLKASAPARVVTVASGAHTWSRMNFDDLESRRRYWPFLVYSQSKLANILFTFELARRLQGTGVTANCLHPGMVDSGFTGPHSGITGLGRLARPLMITPEKGAETMIYLAGAPELARVSGQYFYKKKPARASRVARDPETARRLWELSEGYLRRHPPN